MNSDMLLLVLGLVLLVLAVLVFFALIVLVVAFWIIMLVDAAKRNFKTDGEKIVWVLVIIFLQVLGAIIYYFVVKRPSKKLETKEVIKGKRKKKR